MKKQLLLIVWVISGLIMSCSSTRQLSQSTGDHAVFIGSWVGENRIDGDLTTWVQNRFADGTYTILFVTISGNEVNRNVESGKWWIKNGLFYELSPNAMTKPDVYKYTIRSTDNIYFKSTSVDYQFAESRAIENHFDIINIE